MNFEGFTLPDGAWLPPELLYLLPGLSGSQLKVTIAVLYHNMQVGGSENLSLTDIENFTGLSRQTVNDCLQYLVRDEILDREPVGRSFAYFPIVKKPDCSVKKIDPSGRGVSIDSGDSSITILTDSLSTKTVETVEIIKQLRAAGIFLKTAQGLVDQFPPERISQAMAFFHHAMATSLAQGPGWLVLAIREGWEAPLGWKASADGSRCVCRRCRYEHEGGYEDWSEA